MSRTVKEWIGNTDDSVPPPRVRDRVFKKFDGICQECTLPITSKRWICDHRIALINGGENREANLGPIHEACDKMKTAADVAEKSRVYSKRIKHLGIRAAPRKKIRSRPFAKAEPQRTATRPIERRS